MPKARKETRRFNSAFSARNAAVSNRFEAISAPHMEGKKPISGLFFKAKPAVSHWLRRPEGPVVVHAATEKELPVDSVQQEPAHHDGHQDVDPEDPGVPHVGDATLHLPFKIMPEGHSQRASISTEDKKILPLCIYIIQFIIKM